MKYNILFGGKAGQGSNILANLLGKALIKKGYYVFYSRDYQSLIRGGHNFNILTFSDKPVSSNDSKLDFLVCLDEETIKMHKKKLNKNAIILKGAHKNMYFVGQIFKIFGIDMDLLREEFRKIENFNENIREAKKGYESVKEKIKLNNIKNKKNKIIEFSNGSQAISLGAIKSGLDIYYAYPMTPTTPLLNELAEKEKSKNIFIMELENEIAVINAGIGSAMTGAKVMIGTSGGGFDLMTEAISLSGMAEIPIVICLGQRPGPGTGVATYTSQSDLNDARRSGHGEFNRVVLAPGDTNECQEIVNQCFYFSQKYKIPAIILTDKHLAESHHSSNKKPKIVKVKKSIEMKRYNSYEKDVKGNATEDSEVIIKNTLHRLKIRKNIEKEAKRFSKYEIYGNKNSRVCVVFWGSTKGAVLDAINDLKISAIQIKYIEPFPKEIKKILNNKKIILVENNSRAQLGELIKEKIGIDIENKNKILKFDGRPFFSDELKEEIKRRMK
jgi:2-oxoglutarate ferredoxin oxidoreductase subunit alpha